MAILCRHCGREYDVTLFSFGGTVHCDCGAQVELAAGHVKAAAGADSRRAMREISRGADRIVSLILYSDLPDVDVAIAIERLRERADALFPGRGDFFRRVYESRFARISEQWGGGAS